MQLFRLQAQSKAKLPLPSVREISEAEGVGFEPTVTVRPQRFSRPPQSSTLAPLRGDDALTFCPAPAGR